MSEETFASWVAWVDNVLHNLCDMTSVELFDDDDYGLWLFEQMSKVSSASGCVQEDFSLHETASSQVGSSCGSHRCDVSSFSELIFWIQMMLSLL
jgi:hypothetical protein